MSSPNTSTPLLDKNPTKASKSITKKLKSQLLAFLATLSLVTLITYLSESTQLLLHRTTYTTPSRPSAAQPPTSHKADRIHVATLPLHYLPHPTQHPARRLIIIGDIHGCLTTLHALLRNLTYSPATDHLIFAGDFVNKGPDSHGVVSFARKASASCVRGNHEDKFLKALSAKGRVAKGGDAKMKALAKQLTKEDVEFIQACPHVLSLGSIPVLHAKYKGVVVVHAGLEPGVPLHSQDAYSVMNMRAIVPRSGRPEARRDKGVAWWRVWNKAQRRLERGQGTLVVYGHDSRQGLVEKEFSVGLDSGCVRGGRLSALVIGGGEGTDGMRVVSVKSHVYD